MKFLKLKTRYILLFLLQIFDGWFTYLGVKKFGTIDIEGNPIVHYVMMHMGPTWGLLFIKSVACLLILFLFVETCKNKTYLKMYPKCLDFLVFIYVVVVWTWFEILFMQSQPVGNMISKFLQSIS